MIAVLEVLLSILGVIAQIGFFTQAYRIYKNKSAENVSFWTFAIYLQSMILQAVYGFTIKSSPLIIVNSIGTIGCLAILITYMVYRKK